MIDSVARAEADDVEILDVLLQALSAGASLTGGVERASHDHPSRRLRRRFRAILAARTGETLASSMQAAGCTPEVVAAVRLGEASGKLREALESVQDALEFRLELRRRALDAWLQPLVSIAVAASTVVLLAALGAASRLLEDAGPSHHVLRIVRALWSLPEPLPIVIVLAVFAAIAFVVKLLRTERWAARVAERLPFTGAARRETERALALHQASVLVGAGMPVQDALRFAASSLRDGSSARVALSAASHRVASGSLGSPETEWPLLDAILATPSPPSRLAELLHRASGWHESERDRIADSIAAAASIAAIATAGLACGAVIVLAWTGYFTALSTLGE